jgi:hypothetical protein
MDRSYRVLRAPRAGLGSAIVGASRGLSEAMVGVSSTRCGLPSFGAEDATCSPNRRQLQLGSPAFVLVHTTFSGSPESPI